MFKIKDIFDFNSENKKNNNSQIERMKQLNETYQKRGEFIKENDLINSIKNRTLSGVGLDVLKNEFKSDFKNNPKKNKLFNFFIKNKKYNIFVTPKQGGSNKSAWGFTEKIIINELIKYEKKYN